MQKTLEQEFKEYKEHHIYEIIGAALTICENKGIYDHMLLKDYKNLDLKGSEKAFYVVDDLYDRLIAGKPSNYYEVYDMCWDRIVKERNLDDESYRLNTKYD